MFSFIVKTIDKAFILKFRKQTHIESLCKHNSYSFFFERRDKEEEEYIKYIKAMIC